MAVACVCARPGSCGGPALGLPSFTAARSGISISSEKLLDKLSGLCCKFLMAQVDNARCPACGGLYALIGLRHRCNPAASPSTGSRAQHSRPDRPGPDKPAGKTVDNRAQAGKASGGGKDARPAAGRAGTPNRRPREAAENIGLSVSAAGRASSSKSKSRAGAKRLGSRGPAPGSGGRPRKGEEGKTLQARKPWEAEGISQATWYRRQAEAKKAKRK